MRKFSILFVLLFTLFEGTLFAQRLSVIQFELRERDMAAKTNPRDAPVNGAPCALVRVQVAAPDCIFSSDYIVGEVKQGFGEYLVYMAEGATKLSIAHPDFLFTPLEFIFPEPLMGRRAYALVLEVPIYTHYAEIVDQQTKNRTPKEVPPTSNDIATPKISNQNRTTTYNESLSPKRSKPSSGSTIRGFQAYTEFGVMPLVFSGDDESIVATLSFTAGHRFGDLFYLGGGIDFGMAFLGYEYFDSSGYSYYESSLSYFIGAHAYTRLYFTRTKVQPYWATSIGGIYLTEDAEFAPTLGSELGMHIPLKNKTGLYLSVGPYAILSYETIGLNFKLGVSF